MFEKLEVLQLAQGLARYGAARQAAIAENVANADTPGYRARDLAPFSEVFRTTDGAMRATRTGHLAGGAGSAEFTPREAIRPGAASPDGNTVTLESEMFAAAEAKSVHDRALAIYRSSLSVLRTAASGRG